MAEHELADLIRDWASAEAADGPSPSLRPRIAAIPDVVSHRRVGSPATFGDRRMLLILAAVLALTVAVGGAVAIGAGLIKLPWQESVRIHPGAIDPCALVAGGPSAQVERFERGLVDYEEEANISSPPRINSFEGRGCLFLATEDLNSLALFQLRNDVTGTDEAADVAAGFFRTGRPPFSQGPIRTLVQGHPAWVGTIAVPGHGDDPDRVGMAVSAAPYFFVVVPEVGTELALSDAAGLAWWEGHMKPQAHALAGELLALLEGQ